MNGAIVETESANNLQRAAPWAQTLNALGTTLTNTNTNTTTTTTTNRGKPGAQPRKADFAKRFKNQQCEARDCAFGIN
jgi:hypothetical protein